MTPLEQLQAQKIQIEAQISAIVQKGMNATPADLALMKAYKRQLQLVNAQIVILVNTPPEPEDVPF